MKKRKKKVDRLRLFSQFILIYMLLAFLWWAVLLIKKNNELFHATAQSKELIWQAEGNNGSFELTSEYQSLVDKRDKQFWMVLGEGSVFVIALMIGIWFINRGYQREIDTIRQKRNFLLAITHELKSPLASISLILETLQTRRLERSHQENLAKHGIKETERLSALVENLLLSSRLDKSFTPVFETTDLYGLIEEVSEDIKRIRPEADIRLSSPKENPVMAKVDIQGFHSVMFNLIENALKYSDPGSPVEIEITSKKEETIIKVRDQGIGIPPGERQKIFQQFYRSGHEETRSTKGTGLGLYIVSKMMEYHGGKIHVESNTPKGSTFVLRIPKK